MISLLRAYFVFIDFEYQTVHYGRTLEHGTGTVPHSRLNVFLKVAWVTQVGRPGVTFSSSTTNIGMDWRVSLVHSVSKTLHSWFGSQKKDCSSLLYRAKTRTLCNLHAENGRVRAVGLF